MQTPENGVKGRIHSFLSMGAVDGPGLRYVVLHPFSAFTEAFRSLKISLLLNRGTMPKVVGITSTMPNEGKTTVANNFAQYLANTGTRVLLVDGDKITHGAKDLAKVKVVAEVLGDERGPKIVIQKFKNKTGYKKRQGHRQELTRIKITSIA